MNECCFATVADYLSAKRGDRIRPYCPKFCPECGTRLLKDGHTYCTGCPAPGCTTVEFEAPYSPASFNTEKVFCSECEYFREWSEPVCVHPENTKTFDTWRDRFDEFQRSPSVINADNDCKLWEAK